MDYTGKIEFNLNFKYLNSEEYALKDVKGKIDKGQCIVLCGESGCGKSTLLRGTNRLIPEFYEGTIKGACYINGVNTDNLSIGETGKYASSVFQDPRSQFFTLNSTSEIAFGIENHGKKHEEIVKRVEEAFDIFDMKKLKDRNVFELSSGERQIIAILSAWATDTEIFLLDEPAANLDTEATEKLSNVLKKLKLQGKTIIISEHRLYYLKEIADEYWIINKGSIVEKINSEDMKGLSLSELKSRSLRVTDLSMIKDNNNEKFPLSKTDKFKAEEIDFAYSKKTEKILSNYFIEGETGEIIGITGNNGAGKTTLGKIITGLYKTKRGSFYLNDEKINRKELIENGIFIMQEAEFQFFTNSVINELLYGIKHTEENIKKAEQLLQDAGLLQYRNRHPFSLSGGEMQRLVMLLAYMSQKKIIVLDEPTAGLDYINLNRTINMIKKMQESHIVFIISHDKELIQSVCTRIININDNNNVNKRQKSCDDKNRVRVLDPRTKIVILIASMIVGIFTDLQLILSSFIVLVCASLYEKKYSIIAAFGSIMTFICMVYFALPNVGTSFIAHFFPRLLLIGMSVSLVILNGETTRTLAGMRKLNIPEKIIMIASVIFRFFPVLTKDLKIMLQSVKTRGFFKSVKDKIKRMPEYFEVLIVPMAFRVMRIADSLSASAETRGISLEGKRYSYIEMRFKPADFIMIFILISGIITGLFI